MIEKRGKNTWLIRIYIGRDEEGKRQYHNETFYAPLKSLAQKREAELKEKLKCPAGPKSKIMNLGEFIHYHLENLEDSLKPGSLEQYEYCAKTVIPFIGDLQLWNLTGESLTLALRGHFDHMEKRTRKNLYAFVHMAVNAAIKAKRAPADALLDFRIPKASKKNRRVFNADEFKLILVHLQEYRYGLVIRLLIYTGARAGEILGLCWDSVDFKLGTITICRTINLQHRTLSDETKTENSYRTLELDDETLNQLKQQYEQQKKEITSVSHDGLVFQTINGRPVCYKTIQKTWKAILKKASLPLIRIHDVRHSVITYQLNEGVPAIQVAEMVGQDVNTTNRMYAQKIRRSKVVDFEAH